MSQNRPSVKSFAAERGYDLPDMPRDGEYYRWGKHDRHWAIAFPAGDGRRVHFGDWVTGEIHHFFPDGQPNSPENRRLIDQAMREQADKRAEKQAFAAKVAEEMWASAKEGLHPYLTKKGLSTGLDTRINHDGILLIPMQINGRLAGLQRIFPDGSKRFLSGQLTKGTSFVIKPDGNKRVYLCEGFATGASIHMATGRSVIVAFSASNLEVVARQLVSNLRAVVVCADNDAFTDGNPGLTAGKRAATILNCPVIFPTFANPAPGYTDFNDLMLAEGIAVVKEQVEQESSNVRPLWSPEDKRDLKNCITNYMITRWDKDGPILTALTPQQVWDKFNAIVGDKIIAVHGKLVFSHNLMEIKTSSELTGGLKHLGIGIDWRTNLFEAMTKTELLTFVLNRVKSYDFVSRIPHYPPRQNVFYRSNVIPQRTKKLDELVEMFSYATDVDRQMSKAMFMTPFWGGAPGARPAFLIDGIDIDTEGNRGIGKTTLTEAVSELCGYGSCIDLNSKIEGDEMRRRIINSLNDSCCILRFDNVKGQNLSHEVVESIITSKTISGHKMNKGHASTPNYFTVLITFNDAALCKDMAQRCQIIRLIRSKKGYDPAWPEKLRRFIADNRDNIIADIAFLLQSEPPPNMHATCRFAEWERGVLSLACFNLKEVQNAMKASLENIDDDSRLRGEIKEVVMLHLTDIIGRFGKNLDPSTTSFAIPRRTLMEWIAELFGRGTSLRYASKRFAYAKPIEFLPVVRPHRGVDYEVWVGPRGGDELFTPTGCWRLKNGVGMEEWKFV